MTGTAANIECDAGVIRKQNKNKKAKKKKEEKEGGNNFILPPLSPFPGAVIETITILYSFHDFVRS